MSEQQFELSRRAFIGSAAVFGAAMALAPRTAFAETAAEKQAEADAVMNQLVSLQADLEQASNDYYGALEQQQAAEQAMEAEQVKIDDATQKIDSLQSRLSDRARTMYRNGPSGFMDFVLGATTFNEFTQNWGLLNDLNDEDADMVAQTKQLRSDLQVSRDNYAADEAKAAQQAAAAAEAKDRASALVQQAQESYNQLSAEAQELLEQEQAAAALAAAQAAAAEQAASQAAAGGGSYDNGGGTSDNGGGSSESGGGSYSGGGSSESGGGSSYSGGGSSGDYSAVVSYALSRIGCPYVWGAEGPDSFDCSGLVVWAYRQVGLELPHYTESLYACAKNIVPVSEARPGDVLYRYGHVGIAEGYGGVPYVHAPTFGAYVRDTDSLSWSGFTAALQF